VGDRDPALVGERPDQVHDALMKLDHARRCSASSIVVQPDISRHRGTPPQPNRMTSLEASRPHSIIWRTNPGATISSFHVLITGTSAGFGKAAVKLFASEGWNVIATMRSPAAETELGLLPDVLVTRLDVQDRGSIDAAIAAGIARFGRIDALINNAGFGLFGVFEETAREKVEEQFAVNVFGVMDVTRAILPHFREQKSGLILNVSSGAGVFTLPMLSLYCSSKFALEGFSEALSYELASQNIVVKIVEPGGVISTDFGKRSGAEAVQNGALADYAPFVERTSAIFGGLRAARLASSEDVVQVIFGAATDGTAQLRYVASQDIQPLVKARRETSEKEYVELMRSQFFFKP
jgi:NAD(P)-dependent dehydrogenase (short-subunit alcohol dehydrogenase family)